MKKALIALALLGLGACAQPTTSPTAQTKDTRNLEEKIERLEKSLEYLVNEKQEYKAQITKYKSCTDRCSKMWNHDEDAWERMTKAQQKQNMEDRRACWDECEEFQPDEHVGC